MKPGDHNQHPHRWYLFRCGHVGILPAVGETNDVGYWLNKKNLCRGGYWGCKVCKLEQQSTYWHGTSPMGLLGRMRKVLRSIKCAAKRKREPPIQITPDEMVLLWQKQKGTCALCGHLLKITNAHFDHNHKNGKSRGFIHPHCNWMIGYAKDSSDLLRRGAFYLETRQ